MDVGITNCRGRVQCSKWVSHRCSKVRVTCARPGRQDCSDVPAEELRRSAGADKASLADQLMPHGTDAVFHPSSRPRQRAKKASKLYTSSNHGLFASCLCQL